MCDAAVWCFRPSHQRLETFLSRTDLISPRLSLKLQIDHNGSFLLFCQPAVPGADHAKGEENEKRFWELSEKLAKQEFA